LVDKLAQAIECNSIIDVVSTLKSGADIREKIEGNDNCLAVAYKENKPEVLKDLVEIIKTKKYNNEALDNKLLNKANLVEMLYYKEKGEEKNLLALAVDEQKYNVVSVIAARLKPAELATLIEKSEAFTKLKDDANNEIFNPTQKKTYIKQCARVMLLADDVGREQMIGDVIRFTQEIALEIKTERKCQFPDDKGFLEILAQKKMKADAPKQEQNPSAQNKRLDNLYDRSLSM